MYILLIGKVKKLSVRFYLDNLMLYICNIEYPGDNLLHYIMAGKEIDIEKLVRYWTESSDNDFQTMLDLYKTKHYHWSLFMGHLVIEKLAKAVYVKNVRGFPPLIHDLRRLMEKAQVVLSNKHIKTLDSISRFNIDARYDDYKRHFYKMCTKEFTENWLSEIKEIRLWIKNMLLK